LGLETKEKDTTGAPKQRRKGFRGTRKNRKWTLTCVRKAWGAATFTVATLLKGLGPHRKGLALVEAEIIPSHNRIISQTADCSH
jgi:hypothetical protein